MPLLFPIPIAIGIGIEFAIQQKTFNFHSYVLSEQLQIVQNFERHCKCRSAHGFRSRSGVTCQRKRLKVSPFGKVKPF